MLCSNIREHAYILKLALQINQIIILLMLVKRCEIMLSPNKPFKFSLNSIALCLLENTNDHVMFYTPHCQLKQKKGTKMIVDYFFL